MDVLHHWHGNTFWLNAEKIMYWEETKTLIASDLHLGKSGHFRKSGIAVPQEVMKQDLMRLFSLLQHYQPKRLLVVGDFFHSHANKELAWFNHWRSSMVHIEWLLVQGNHDILPKEWYQQQEITVVPQLMEHNLCFVHEPPAHLPENGGVVCGHIHPGVRIKGAGRQSISMPCFHFSERQCMLPAFGMFTGIHLVKPKPTDKVFGIANKTIIPLS